MTGEGGQEHVTSRLYKFLSYVLNIKFKLCLTFCCNRCIVTEGGTDKNQPRQNPPRTIEIEFIYWTFVRDFCTRLTKNRGGPRCVTYFVGVPGCVTKCYRGRGSKLAKNSVTYFMDGPFESTRVSNSMYIIFYMDASLNIRYNNTDQEQGMLMINS